MVPFSFAFGAQSSLAMMACFSASSNGPKLSHSVPSFGDAADEGHTRHLLHARQREAQGWR